MNALGTGEFYSLYSAKKYTVPTMPGPKNNLIFPRLSIYRGFTATNHNSLTIKKLPTTDLRKAANTKCSKSKASDKIVPSKCRQGRE